MDGSARTSYAAVMESSWSESRAAFEAAAEWFVSTASHVADRWDQPGLGEWDVRALVGHASRSFVTVETYLAQHPDTIEVESAPLYYRAIRPMLAGPGVAERGRAAGEALGGDPVGSVREVADRVTALVRRSTGDELLTSIAGGMRLRDYLPTRTFELVIHTCDLAVALGLPVTPPAVAARDTMRLCMEVAIDDGRSGDVLLALTGRRPLPPGFSIV